jgi:hypothetical protein
VNAGPEREAQQDEHEPRTPRLYELFVGNLRVLLVVAFVTGAAYGLWRLLVVLFPGVAWLQPKE